MKLCVMADHVILLMNGMMTLHEERPLLIYHIINHIDNRLVVAKDRDAFTFPELSPDVTCYGNGVNFK